MFSCVFLVISIFVSVNNKVLNELNKTLHDMAIINFYMVDLKYILAYKRLKDKWNKGIFSKIFKVIRSFDSLCRPIIINENKLAIHESKDVHYILSAIIKQNSYPVSTERDSH